MNRIEAAVRHYKSHYLHNIQGLLEWYASLDSLDEAIDNASLGKDERGKRHPHQRRLEELKMLRARYYLLGYRERISSLSSFNDLLDIVESVTDRVEGLGELYAYDTALRIGSFIGVLPEKVYCTQAQGIWRGDVPEGEYIKVVLEISQVSGVLLGSGEEIEIKLPSSKLQISKPFQVESSEVTNFVYDLTVVKAGQNGQYILKPQIGQSGADQSFTRVGTEGQHGDNSDSQKTNKGKKSSGVNQ